MTCKLALTQMSTTDYMQASTYTDVHNRMCKLALTLMSKRDDVQAGSYTDVHNR
ncbi:hypothetical protein DPMN_142493 [Dreissena polymorpha]|uniref:Uncharacterized protein n=1 Tax=Dreissena polymorpha TaxID=45954 RepID=A0A9D4GBW1_DREPO|nr:hypothetical protein DPMN_142493 [Dreissena polymorpha]